MTNKKDMLTKIFEMKLEFEEKFYNIKEMSTKEREELTLKVLMMIHVEIAEFVREMNYKLLQTERKKIDRTSLLDELVDIGHFYFFLCLIWELDSESFYSTFKRKNEIIEKRVFIHDKVKTNE